MIRRQDVAAERSAQADVPARQIRLGDRMSGIKLKQNFKFVQINSKNLAYLPQ
jgi:hypothetical protein